mgnify:CR=1 FL=1
MKLWAHLTVLMLAVFSPAYAAQADELRGTGDMGVVVERASGSLLVVENTTRTQLGRIEGLGDLSHASAVYSRDARYACRCIGKASRGVRCGHRRVE